MNMCAQRCHVLPELRRAMRQHIDTICSTSVICNSVHLSRLLLKQRSQATAAQTAWNARHAPSIYAHPTPQKQQRAPAPPETAHLSAPPETALSAADVMIRVFITSAGVVATAASAPAIPPIAMYCQASSSCSMPNAAPAFPKQARVNESDSNQQTNQIPID
jgi:hypothetical protein